MEQQNARFTRASFLIVAMIFATVGGGLWPAASVAQVEPSALINISTRARVQTGDNVMIGGFWITGTGSKTVLIRARGGSLGGAPFNNPGVLANPTMQIYSGSTVIAQNNDWGVFNAMCLAPCVGIAPVSDTSVPGLTPCEPNPGQTMAPPGCAQESALLVTLPPGGYTAIVSGVGGTSGMGLVEVFEVGTGTATLVNISTRARVLTGDNVMIGGFWVGGTGTRTVLIRARGASLGGAPFNNPGVMANPTMQLYSGSTVIAQNNDWKTTDALCMSPATACGDVHQITATGMDPCQPNPGQGDAPAGCGLESTLLVTLPPGGYTAIVSGVGGTSGMGLVEAFETTMPPFVNNTPVAHADGPYSGLVGYPVTVDGSGSVDADNDPLTYAWDFGDGATGSGVFPTHIYSAPGTYTVGLTVSDPYNASHTAASTTSTISVQGSRPPVANAGGPYAGIVSEGLTLSAVGSADPDGDALTYSWDFGDGSPVAVGMSVTHVYAAAATYTITVTATDPGGLFHSATTTATISVFNPSNVAPSVFVTVPSQGLVLQNLELIGSGTDPDNDTMTYSWNFGDGTSTAFGPSPSVVHEYAQAGTYTATLTANDGHGHSVSAGGTITITMPAAPVAFAQSPLIARRTNPFTQAYRNRVAIELDGAGVPPLTFNIVSYPAHWASDAQTLNVAAGNVYQWWDPIGNNWRPECSSGTVPDFCIAPFSTFVDQSTGELFMTSAGAPPTVSYLPEICRNWSGLSDSFTFTVTDGNGVTSAPAVVAISLTPMTCVTTC